MERTSDEIERCLVNPILIDEEDELFIDRRDRRDKREKPLVILINHRSLFSLFFILLE